MNIVEVYESYGHRENEVTIWKTKELAESHGLYPIELVALSLVSLSQVEINDLNSGRPIYCR